MKISLFTPALFLLLAVSVIQSACKKDTNCKGRDYEYCYQDLTSGNNPKFGCEIIKLGCEPEKEQEFRRNCPPPPVSVVMIPAYP